MTEPGDRVAHKVVSAAARPSSEEWWRRGALYQVYPRSFQDSDGDGVGDLQGISGRLDYLSSLGVDALWLSPIFRSPMADFGYDVSDYEDVDPLFGTLADLDELIAALHGHGMKLILDLVPNHTSSLHRWFVDSRSSRAAAHRDWYIWRDARPDGSPPNAWIAGFGGSAWEWDAQTGQYYFHSFLKEQPDLNWANPEVRSAMHDVIRFWFRRGVDGFRIDVVNLLAKRFELVPLPHDVQIDEGLFDGTQRALGFLTTQRWAATSAIYSIVRQIRAVADEFDDRVLIGELWMPIPRLIKFYGKNLDGLQLPFNFQLITVDWTPAAVHRAVAEYEKRLPVGAWPNWVLGNHDKPRIATRVGRAQARVAAVLLLTLRGTPTLYYGDELGMLDVDVAADAQRDPQGLRGGESRDPERTPMRWDTRTNAGFSNVTPWLPMGDDANWVNVEVERAESGSILSLYTELLTLRRNESALHSGKWIDLGRNDKAIAYLRSDTETNFLIVANLTSSRAAVPEAARAYSGRVLLSTTDVTADRPFDAAGDLEPNQALVVVCTNTPRMRT